MAKLIDLEGHLRPKILLINYSPEEVEFLSIRGYATYSVTTDRIQVSKMPIEENDIDIVFARVGQYTFASPPAERNAGLPHLKAITFANPIRALWNANKFVIFFVQESCSKKEFSAIDQFGGFNKLPTPGYIGLGPPPAYPMPFEKYGGSKFTILSTGPEATVIERYLAQAAHVPIFPSQNALGFEIHPNYVKPLVTDGSTYEQSLAVMIPHYDHYELGFRTPPTTLPEGGPGGFYFLPDFGNHTAKVSQELIETVFKVLRPDLFPDVRYQWLRSFEVEPVVLQRLQLEEQTRKHEQEVDRLTDEMSISRFRYSWMQTMLVAQGDELVGAVSDAFSFLDYQIKNIDDSLTRGQRKKHDLEVSRKSFFSICEVKSASGGAKEDFISDTENHQATYIREHNQGRPRALLIVNHSLAIDPASRHKTFYRDTAIESRLDSSQITAIDTAKLYVLCCDVACGRMEKASAQVQIESGKAFM